MARLGGIADMFLVHDRPIVRPVDDSVARIVAGRPLLLRRARGYAPAPVIEQDLPPGILALGGHLKATVALTMGKGAVLSQHIGDLETAEARDAYDRARRRHHPPPRHRARVSSSAICIRTTIPAMPPRHRACRPSRVQHHLAHVAACMAEHRLQPPVLGVSFDGTGYGPDGTVWGGEFLLVRRDRLAARRPPPAVPPARRRGRGPRAAPVGARAALFELFGPACLAMTDLAPVARVRASRTRGSRRRCCRRGVNAPITTSAGRLFDAVSALLPQPALDLRGSGRRGTGVGRDRRRSRSGRSETRTRSR